MPEGCTRIVRAAAVVDACVRSTAPVCASSCSTARGAALPGREMGKKRRQEKTNAGTLKAAPAKAAPAEDAAALASAPADADAVDQRVDYTDQHGTHWVADAGALQPVEQAAAELCLRERLADSRSLRRRQLGRVRRAQGLRGWPVGERAAEPEAQEGAEGARPGEAPEEVPHPAHAVSRSRPLSLHRSAQLQPAPRGRSAACGRGCSTNHGRAEGSAPALLPLRCQC